MPAAVTAPDVAKAATLAPSGELTFASFPITKVEETPDGDVMVTGAASDGSVDTDEQIVDPAWAQKGPGGFQEWFDTAGNVRVQHQAQRDPAGKGLQVHFQGDSTIVKSLVVEPVAKELVRKGILTAYSVGIARPEIVRDPTGRARGGIIKGGQIVELSLVDRPANKNCGIQLLKAAGDGTPQFTGKVFGAAGALAATEDEPKAWKSVSVDLPKSARITVSPATLAKMNTLAARNAVPAVTKAAIVGEPGPELVTMNGAEPVIKGTADDLEAFKAAGAAEDAILGKGSRTFTAEQRREHASEGTALPDGSYPMPDADAVRRAAILIRSKHGNWKAAAKLLARRVKALGIPNPLKKKPKAEKSATAEPDAIKCMKCDGTGMIGRDDAQPCPDCKKGRKKAGAMAKAAGPGAVKKKKVMCPSCGAKQNIKHSHCPECGNPLHPAIPIMKNHDFDCLHCGHEDLDKGEQFCPGCGNANPGYLQVADRKLPMNAEAGKSAGKDRVPDSIAKRGKASKGKKKKDGKKKELPPFLQPDDGDDKDGAAKKAAAVTKKRKGGKKGGKGRSPAVGAVSQTTEGLPPHREPDGAPVEAFEADTSLSDGDHEMKAAQRHRSLGIDAHLAVLHDLTCPAFSPKSVAVCLPNDSLAAIDTEYWQGEALKAASSAGFPAALDEYNRYAALSRDAATLKTADPQLLLDIAGESHKGFLEANADLLKTFMDATPGPGSFPSPSHPMPQQFRRPFVSAGHAATSPQHDAPHSFAVTEGSPVARDFDHGYLTAGHATESPYNAGPRPMPTPAPLSAGNPDSMHFTNVQRANAEQARSAMHDHVSRLFPDVCPMSPEMGATQKPGRPVQPPVGAPIPHAAGKAAKPGKTKAEKKADAARKAAKMAARKAEKARKAAKAEVRKAAKAAELPVQPSGPEPAVTADTITQAVKAATAPLVKRARAQDKALRKLRKTTDAIAGQPDTSAAPFRGAGVAKTVQTSAALAGPRTASESAEQAQTNKMRRLWETWRHTSNPEFQEAAWQELQAMLGTEPLTGYDTGLTPMRRNPMT